MGLDPRQLRAFLAVVETGSIGRAADALHLTEPAVSRIVKRLETQLHVQLFERRTTGMELTTFGQALLPYANLLNTEASHALEELDALRGVDRGTLRIGSVASAAMMVLPKVMERILARSPSLQIEISEAVEDRLAILLANSTIDVVLSGAIPENEDIVQVAEHRFSDRYSVVAATGHALHDRRNLSIRDLLDAQWVMPPEDAEPRKLFAGILKSLDIKPPRVAIETRSPAAIKAIVAQTSFLGWLPEPLFAAEVVAGLLRPLPVKEMTIDRHFYVYRRRRTFVPPPVMRFLEELSKSPNTGRAPARAR